MTAAAVGVVLVLFVVLVVIVASMRIHTYKNLYRNTYADNKEKAQEIAQLQEKLTTLQLENREQATALEAFDETKVKLKEHQEALATTREESARLQERYHATSAELEGYKERYTALEEELNLFKERLESIAEENNKLRINNARLLMKLETEERYQTMRHHKGES